MMEIPKRDMKTQIDWAALEKSWAEQYEEDYGNLFSNTKLNNHRISILVSNVEDGILVTA